MLQSYIELLNRVVRANLGKPIVDVVYRTYTETTSQSAIDDGAGWMHGEVRLHFDDGAVLFLGWGENEGFADHFSLRPSEVSTYRPNTLVDLPASGSPEWSEFRGQRLTGAELRGVNGTPHILVFDFPNGSVAVGDGYDRELGDGDQILVRKLPNPQVAEFGEIFWRVSAGYCNSQLHRTRTAALLSSETLRSWLQIR